METSKPQEKNSPETPSPKTPSLPNLPQKIDFPLKPPKTPKPSKTPFEITFSIKSIFKKIKKSSKPQKIPISLSILTKDIIKDENRAGLDLIIIIDISGSMGGKKLKLVKQTLIFIIENLSKIDRLGLVTFSDKANFLAPLKPMLDHNKKIYKKLIYRLDAFGETDIIGAVEMGLEIFLKREFENEISAIFLLSDGRDTKNENLDILEKVIKEKDFFLKERNMSYKIHSFGYGEGHDENWLSYISDFKDGNFYYVRRNEFIHECFIDCLGGLLSTIAKNCKISIFLDKKCKFVTKYGKSWENKENAKLGILNVDTIISDMDKDFMGEIEISEITDSEKKIKIAIAILNFETENGKNSKSVNLVLDVVNGDNLGEVDKSVLEIYMKMEAGKKIQDFEKLSDLGKLKEADEMMANFYSKVKSSQISCDYKGKINGIIDVKKLRDKKFSKQITKVMVSDQYAPGYTNFKRQRGNAKRMMKKK